MYMGIWDMNRTVRNQSGEREEKDAENRNGNLEIRSLSDYKPQLRQVDE